MATWPLALLAVALLAVPCPDVSGASSGTAATFEPTPNGNFSIEGPGPETNLPAGSILTVQYELRDPNYTSTQKGLYVRVPAPTAQFNVSYGQLRLQMPGITVAFNSTNWTNPANTTTSEQLLNETVFPNTGRVANDRAALSSGDLALTSPETFGALTIDLRWRWAASPSFGANFTGSWEPSASGVAIEPDQFVQLLSPASQTVSPGQGVAVCLGGPVAGRTFSLHAVMPSPRLDFATRNGTVAPNGVSPYCQTLVLPTWLEPQNINVYVWDLSTSNSTPGVITSFLLYVIKVNVVGASPSTPSLYGIPLGTWYLGLGAATAVLLLAIAYALWRGGPGSRRAAPDHGSASGGRTRTTVAGVPPVVDRDPRPPPPSG